MKKLNRKSLIYIASIAVKARFQYPVSFS